MLIYLEDKFIKDYTVDFEDENNSKFQIHLQNITSVEHFIEGIEKQAHCAKTKRSNVFYVVWNSIQNRFEFISFTLLCETKNWKNG